MFETEAFPPRISGVLFQANSTDTTVVSECRVDRTCPVFASEELLVKLLPQNIDRFQGVRGEAVFALGTLLAGASDNGDLSDGEL